MSARGISKANAGSNRRNQIQRVGEASAMEACYSGHWAAIDARRTGRKAGEESTQKTAFTSSNAFVRTMQMQFTLHRLSEVEMPVGILVFFAASSMIVGSAVRARSPPAIAPVPNSTTTGLTCCPSSRINTLLNDFGRSGKMPPRLGRWLNDPHDLPRCFGPPIA